MHSLAELDSCSSHWRVQIISARIVESSSESGKWWPDSRQCNGLANFKGGWLFRNFSVLEATQLRLLSQFPEKCRHFQSKRPEKAYWGRLLVELVLGVWRWMLSQAAQTERTVQQSDFVRGGELGPKCSLQLLACDSQLLAQKCVPHRGSVGMQEVRSYWIVCQA